VFFHHFAQKWVPTRGFQSEAQKKKAKNLWHLGMVDGISQLSEFLELLLNRFDLAKEKTAAEYCVGRFNWYIVFSYLYILYIYMCVCI
jgi:hypothetical protein